MKYLVTILLLMGIGPAYAACQVKEHPYLGTTVQTSRSVHKGNFVLGEEIVIWPSYHGGNTQQYRINATRNGQEWRWIKGTSGTFGHVVINGDRIELPFTSVNDTDVRTTGFSTARVQVKERIYTRIDEAILRRMGDQTADVYMWIGGFEVKFKKKNKKLFYRFLTDDKCVAGIDKATQEIMRSANPTVE